ncbi:MAG: hypothetical protein L0H73_08785 [Nitrococcus sp.]|nr:hypothetical protein [Nitrococcus sp.]
MMQLTEDDERMLESLRKAVHEALERKRRLGQYAVFWRDGRPQRIEPEMLNVPFNDAAAGGSRVPEVRNRGRDIER